MPEAVAVVLSITVGVFVAWLVFTIIFSLIWGDPVEASGASLAVVLGILGVGLLIWGVASLINLIWAGVPS